MYYLNTIYLSINDIFASMLGVKQQNRLSVELKQCGCSHPLFTHTVCIYLYVCVHICPCIFASVCVYM